MTESRLGQFVAHNADYWREVMQRAFLAEVGAPGGASLWGKHLAEHIEFSEHVAAEVLLDKAVTDRGTMWRYARKVGQLNDWGDAMTGCYVAAAWMGLRTSAKDQDMPRRRRPVRKVRR